MIVAVKHIIQEIIKRCGVFCRILQYGECSLMRNISETRENNWIFIKEGCRGKGWKWMLFEYQKQCYPFRLAFSQNTSKIGRISEKKRMEEFVNCCCFLAVQGSGKVQYCHCHLFKILARIFTHTHTDFTIP